MSIFRVYEKAGTGVNGDHNICVGRFMDLNSADNYAYTLSKKWPDNLYTVIDPAQPPHEILKAYMNGYEVAESVRTGIL